MISSLLRLNLIAVVLSFSLGQLVRIQVTSVLAVYPHDALTLSYLLLFIVELIKSKTFKIDVGIYHRWLALLSLWFILSLILNFHRFGFEDSLIGSLYLLRWLGLASIFPVTFYAIKKKIFRLDVRLLLCWSSIFGLFLGVLQYLFLPDTRILYTFGWDDHLYRLIGVFFDPGFTGLMFVLGFILISFRKKLQWLRPLFIIGTMLTYSRASIVALVVAIVLTAVPEKKYLSMLQALILVGFIFISLPTTAGEGVNLARTYSVESRISSSLSGVDIFKSSPIYGIGFNNYRNLLGGQKVIPSHTSAPDNSYVFLLATTGIIGLVLFVGGLFRFAQIGWKSDPVLSISIATISLHSLFNNSWFYVFVLIWFWLLLASTKVKKE